MDDYHNYIEAKGPAAVSVCPDHSPARLFT